jgi:Spy/CpxP family protein refolding chaperone
MTKTIFTAGALALVLAAGTGPMGYGMPGGGGCGHDGFVGGPRLLHALNLSADQKQQVQAILQSHRATFKQLATNERTARGAIADAMFGTNTVTQQTLDGLVQQEAQARTALMNERLAVALQVRGILTPDQIQKASTIHTGMKQLRTQMQALLGETGTATGTN